MVEAALTADTAIDWAEAYYLEHHVWPPRRWRVEGSIAGTSRLLTRRAAEQQQERYGGEVVQLVCEAWAYRDICRRTGRPSVLGERKRGKRR